MPRAARIWMGRAAIVGRDYTTSNHANKQYFSPKRHTPAARRWVLLLATLNGIDGDLLPGLEYSQNTAVNTMVLLRGIRELKWPKLPLFLTLSPLIPSEKMATSNDSPRPRKRDFFVNIFRWFRRLRRTLAGKPALHLFKDRHPEIVLDPQTQPSPPITCPNLAPCFPPSPHSDKRPALRIARTQSES